MDALFADLRFAARSLWRRRTFTLVALATIALSIGAATSIFSVVDTVLFRPLPYREPDRLVAVWQTYPQWKKEPILAALADQIPLDYGEYIPWREKQTSFSGIGLWAGRTILLSTSDGTERLNGARISPSLFDVLGVKPLVGRSLLPGEDVIGGPRVTVMSYETWQVRFGGRRDVIGRTVMFDTVPWTVVGIMPQGFTLERGKPDVAFWIPAGQSANDVVNKNHSFKAIARLKPGVTMEQARVETTQLLQGDAPPDKRGLRLEDYQRDTTRGVRQPLLLLFGAVGVLLLVACVNVATMLLGEGMARRTEIATRVALGASRARLLRQLLTESVLLSLTGAIAGALIAWWATRVMVTLAPERLAELQTVRVDVRVLGAAMLAALTTGVGFGLVPALAMSTGSGGELVRGGGQSKRGRGVLQKSLIAVELALSLVLLIGAALLVRSLSKLTDVDPGFRSENLMVVRTVLPASSFDSARTDAFYADAVARVAALPGVAGVTGIAQGTPFEPGSSSSWYLKDGETDAKQRHTAAQRQVLPNYFGVMGIPLLAGRAFSTEDRSNGPLVAIVSEAAARRDWPNESPIGRRVKFQGEWRTVVGVVGDTKYAKLSADADAAIFTPYAQRPDDLELLVRTRGEPSAMVATVRQTVRDVAPTAVIRGIETMDDLIKASYGDERFRTALITLFGVMASVLAAVGMYGVTSRAVTARSREVGIRVALGATAGAVVRLIVRQTIGGLVIGVVAGIAIAFVATRLLAPFLFGVTPNDPVTYAGAVGLLGLVSVIASWLPARRAGRVHPVVVLRGE
jgi:predicted permease